MADWEAMQLEIAKLREETARQAEQIKTMFNRIEEYHSLVQSVQTLALTVRDLVNGQNALTSSVSGLRKDVDEIKQRPVKRYDAIIAAIISGTVTFLLAKAGIV